MPCFPSKYLGEAHLWASPFLYHCLGRLDVVVPLGGNEMIDLKDLAERFVGAFIKCNCPGYTVSGNLCASIEEAVGLAMEKCSRLNVAPEDKAEQEWLLREKLTEAIKRLKCP